MIIGRHWEFFWDMLTSRGAEKGRDFVSLVKRPIQQQQFTPWLEPSGIWRAEVSRWPRSPPPCRLRQNNGNFNLGQEFGRDFDRIGEHSTATQKKEGPDNKAWYARPARPSLEHSVISYPARTLVSLSSDGRRVTLPGPFHRKWLFSAHNGAMCRLQKSRKCSRSVQSEMLSAATEPCNNNGRERHLRPSIDIINPEFSFFSLHGGTKKQTYMAEDFIEKKRELDTCNLLNTAEVFDKEKDWLRALEDYAGELQSNDTVAYQQQAAKKGTRPPAHDRRWRSDTKFYKREIFYLAMAKTFVKRNG